MIVGLHTDSSLKFPNIALMKLSAYHKSIGDNVDWFNPIFHDSYDKVYYSKIFNFTKTTVYIPNCEAGGSGIDIQKTLPQYIDEFNEDYSLYPDCDHAVGFLTRGCSRNCSWCVVPVKEGKIKPYRTVEQIARWRCNKIVFMDNNVLASEHGLAEIEKLTTLDYRVDFNQGLDARLVTPEIAKLLSKVKWLKYIRFSCDTKPMIEQIRRVVELLENNGLKKQIFVYVLGIDFQQSYYTLQELKSISKRVLPFLQPLRDIRNINTTSPLLKELAWWNNRSAYLKGLTFEQYIVLRKKQDLLDNLNQSDFLEFVNDK